MHCCFPHWRLPKNPMCREKTQKNRIKIPLSITRWIWSARYAWQRNREQWLKCRSDRRAWDQWEFSIRMTTVTGIEKHYHPRKQRVEVDDGWVWNDRLKESIERLNSCSSDDHKKGQVARTRGVLRWTKKESKLNLWQGDELIQRPDVAYTDAVRLIDWNPKEYINSIGIQWTHNWIYHWDWFILCVRPHASRQWAIDSRDQITKSWLFNQAKQAVMVLVLVLVLVLAFT